MDQRRDRSDRLRRELASMKVDNDILKKAAAYFAKDLREVRLD